MKQTLLSAICASMVLSVNAQTITPVGPIVSNAFREDTHVIQTSSRASSSASATTAIQQVDTIWYEDFSSGLPAGWTPSGSNIAICPWTHSYDGSWGFYNGNNATTGGQAINSTSASNGFLINDPDSANNDMYGQPSGTNYQYMSSFITTTPISTVGYPAVRLEFEQFFRYNNSPELQVGVSTDGVTFTYFDAKEDVAANQTSQNPMLYSLDISSIAGNSPTVYLRFGWESRVYYWMIDDIRLVTPPNNDLAINQTFFNGYQDSTQTRYYTQIPEKHANLDTLLFGAALANAGNAPSTSTGIEVTVQKDGNTVYQSQHQNGTLAVAQSDSLNISTPFVPNQGTGSYSVRFESFSDSTDYDSTNNIHYTDFTVTENEYRRDNNNSNQGNWYNATSNWEMLVAYDIQKADTAVAISCYFPNLDNGYGIDIGDPLSYYIYHENDLSTPVASNEFYVVQAQDEDNWVTLPMPANTKLEPGTYYVGFKVYESETAIGSFSGLNENVPPFTVLVRVDGSGTQQWNYTTSVLPFVRLITFNPEACDNVTIAVSGTVTDSTYVGKVNTQVTGGTEPYNYSWTGPNGFSATSANLTNLNTKGTYSLVVTDLNGCTSNQVDFIVAGVVSNKNEFTTEKDLLVYPNPAQDYLNIMLKGNTMESFQIKLYDLKGCEVFSEQIKATQNNPTRLNISSLKSGIYFAKVTAFSGKTTTRKLIITD